MPILFQFQNLLNNSCIKIDVLLSYDFSNLRLFLTNDVLSYDIFNFLVSISLPRKKMYFFSFNLK